MGTKSKFFRAFVEGNTIYDGRVITAEMIDQCVETHNLDSYTPRCNVEHVSGYSPEPPFNGYGHVSAVKAQDDTITIAGKPEKRRALYCEVDANDQLIALAAKDQKPFPSVELTENYAGTGKFGLVGLAFTDRPASIATQALKFSSHAPGSIHAFAPDAMPLEFEAAPADTASLVDGFFAALAAKFKPAERDKPTPPPAPTPPPPPANDNDFASFAAQIGETVGQSIAAALAPVTAAQTVLQGEFASIKAKLESTEQQSFSRPPTGGGGNLGDLTDC